MAIFAQIEKKRLVKKLKAARDRKSAQQGRRIEGRRSYQEINPELVWAAKRKLSRGTALEGRRGQPLSREPGRHRCSYDKASSRI
jgi:hypothetical protein